MMLPLFEWIENSWLGSLIADSIWAFPVIEALHLVALCVLGGAVLVVDMRMLGVGLKQQGIAELAGHARPWLKLGVGTMLVTGVLLFVSEAVKCYYNTSFWVKMITLPFALAFTFGLRARVVSDDGLDTSPRSRLTATASLALWFTVAAAGRWIGFS